MSRGYEGYYRTPYGSYQGQITDGYLGSHQFFIINPPPQLMRHPKWACFSHKGNGRYQIHLHTQPRDIDSGILMIERLIVEAFRL